MPPHVSSFPAWSRLLPPLCALAAILAGGGAFVLFVDHSIHQMRKEGVFLPTDRVPEFVEAIAFHAMDYAAHSQERNEVVFIGDSTCIAESMPTLFQECTGLRAYNLGTPGALGFEGYEIILRAYLEHHPKPQIIAFCLHPSALSIRSEPQWVGDRFVNVYGSGPCVWQFNPQSIAPIVKLAMQMTMDSDRNAYADKPMSAKSGHSFRSLRETMGKQRGFWLWPGNYTRFVNGRLADDTESFPVTENMKEGVAKILRLAGRHDIPVLFRLSPILANGKSDLSRLNAWLDTLEAGEECRVIVSRPEVLKYDRALFGNETPEHCNDRGAREFTRFMAEEVARILHAADTLAESR